MQFDQKPFAFERYLAYFRPRKCVEPRDALEHGDAHMRHGQIQRQTLEIFGRVHLHAVQFATARSLQQIQIGLGGRLTAVFI